MLKAHWRIISWLERIGDNLLIVLAFFLSYAGRDSFFRTIEIVREAINTNNIGQSIKISSSAAPNLLGPVETYFIVLGLSLPLFNAILELLGAYKSMRLSSPWQLFRVGVFSSLLTFLCLGSLLYLLKLDLSRSFVGLFCGTSGLFLFIERYLILRVLRYFRAKGKNFRNVLIVGTGVQARKMYHEVGQSMELGLRVVGFVETRPLSEVGLHSEVYDLPARIVADPESFESALKRYVVDEVLFTDVIQSLSVMQSLAKIAVEEGVRVTLTADLFSLEIFNSELSYIGDIPLLHYHPSAGVTDSPAHIVKRWIDVVVSFGALLFLLPLFVAVAVGVKLSGPGPIFFSQRRVGLNGRTFTLYKFRSMISNAERLLGDLKERNEMSGPVFKIKDDPRVTKFGKFIRRYSLDELPQLWNVLKGDMSLVGPRPPLPEEVSLYLRKHRKRLSMRPGLTCTWQVSGRNEIPDFEKWAALDLEYIDNWSLTADLKLLLRTIPAVLTGAGAR